MLSEHRTRTPLAIVGIGCQFPGGANSPDSFWQLLCGETDATGVVPENRWNNAKYYDPNPAKLGKMVTRRGGFLSEIDQFDAQFFGISPREANLLDPQQRLLLQTTWAALEDAGIPVETVAGTDVGVFIGGFTLDYQLLQNRGRTSRYRFKPHSATGMMMTMLANRISFTFDFRGPSMTIDTACSSSLVAVHLAALSIWNGECDLALAGGVNIMIGPNTAIAESKSGFLSSDGRCKAFDGSADGYGRGEGGAVVVIKPLEQALRNGDEIYAQILGTAVSQDGHTDSITVPSEEAQQSAIAAALRRARIRPNEIGYVEAHGTGTPVGDPVEMRALAKALATDRAASDPLLVGSVKTNIGHLEAGAGVAGLIKTALVLKHGYIPANLHLVKAHSQIPLADLNIDVPRSGRPFPACQRRMAGVNSFGFGGTNAHVVLAEHPAVGSGAAANETRSAPLAILPISARSEEALVATAHQLAEHLVAHPELTLSDVGYTLSRRRSHLNYRRAVVAASIDGARDELFALASIDQTAASRTQPSVAKLAFVCSGMGPQWWKMCRGLLDVYPAFTESILRSDRELSRYTDWSLIEELRADEADSRMAETEVAQPANFAIQIALAQQLNVFGIHPDAVIGHSAGEVAAHHLAGLLTFEQAIKVIYHRSRLQQRTSGRGRMLAVGLSAESLAQTIDGAALEEIGRRVSIAAINGPSAITIAGDNGVLDDIASQLDDVNVFNRFLTVKVPYHTHYMDTVRDDLYIALEGLSSEAASIPLYSTVTGERLDGYSSGAAYWWQNTRATVLFEPTVRRMLEDGYTHFVELGPHPVLAASLFEIAGNQETEAVVVATQRRNQDDARTLMNCVGALHCHGHTIAWEALYPAHGARLQKLPSYPWQCKRFWNETEEAAEELHYTPVHPLLGQPVGAIHPTWEAELSTAGVPFLSDHQVQGTVLVPGAVFIEMALAAAKEVYGSSDYSVENLTLERVVVLDDTCDPILRTTLYRDKGTLEFASFTAAPGGDLKWTIAATAELNTLSTPPDRVESLADAENTVTIDGDEFYTRTQAIGFAYGDAFQTIAGLTFGDGWAVGEIRVPAEICNEIDIYRFHPALIDGALQTLLGSNLLANEANQGPYLPTRIRQSSIYRSPEKNMIAHVRVVSATGAEIESDITVTSDDGEAIAVFNGFLVQSLNASSRMSPERLDKGIYEIHWVANGDIEHDQCENPTSTGSSSWLVFVDTDGFGTALADQLRCRGHRVRTVTQQSVSVLTATDGGYAIDPGRPEQLDQVLEKYLDAEGDLTGIINCWPLDISEPSVDQSGQIAGVGAAEISHQIGVFTILRVAKALASHVTLQPRLFLITANAQPVLETDALAVEQSTIWGLGRVIGHQEFVKQWGGLIDIDDVDDQVDTAARICEHILNDGGEDQIAFRGRTAYVPRLRLSNSLTQPFPTKLSPDATYVVTGGAGALGRIAATYLAERGARHIALLSRRGVPPRSRWSQLSHDDSNHATINAIRKIEQLGAEITTASVDITDGGQVESWLRNHNRKGGRPVRGIFHAAGSVDDRLLVNMNEADLTKVMAPKVTGTRVLHNMFKEHDLEFFVMFGSAGSVIASPGQGNYAAANAFLDAFAHYRRAQGLPALTIGWGPWSVGMVEELKLERIYAQRGIELITPAAGARILDRLINQKVPNVIAISADWRKARSAGLSGQLPPVFSELGTGEGSVDRHDSELPILDSLSGRSEADQLDIVANYLRRLVAAVFDLPADDIGPDDILDDIGMDSMMAMDFRNRINANFAIDLPVLEVLRGVSASSLAVRVLSEVESADAAATESAEQQSEPTAADDDIERFMQQLSDADLSEVLAALEEQAGEQKTGEAHF